MRMNGIASLLSASAYTRLTERRSGGLRSPKFYAIAERGGRSEGCRDAVPRFEPGRSHGCIQDIANRSTAFRSSGPECYEGKWLLLVLLLVYILVNDGHLSQFLLESFHPSVLTDLATCHVSAPSSSIL